MHPCKLVTVGERTDDHEFGEKVGKEPSSPKMVPLGPMGGHLFASDSTASLDSMGPSCTYPDWPFLPPGLPKSSLYLLPMQGFHPQLEPSFGPRVVGAAEKHRIPRQVDRPRGVPFPDTALLRACCAVQVTGWGPSLAVVGVTSPGEPLF